MQLQELPTASRNGGNTSRGRVLLQVFEALDAAGIIYCVQHGYATYPQQIPSDVDCIVFGVNSKQLAALLVELQAARIDARLVSWKSCFFVLSINIGGDRPCFVCLDLSADYDLGMLRLRNGSEIVGTRRRYRQFWVPETGSEFACYLARKVHKSALTPQHARRLGELYERDPTGCERETAALWGGRGTRLIVEAARSKEWDRVIEAQRGLRAELWVRLLCRHPWSAAANCLRKLGRMTMSILRPREGLAVAFLGPDGAGKSSVLSAVSGSLTGPFNRSAFYGFAPGLLRWFRPPDGANTRPHALPPRSPAMSVARALGYWLAYYLLCYRPAMRLHRARSTLVLHDRHLVDALIDPKRYRYGGPMWLLKFIWMLVPQPDVVILLDAPPEILQARKQEVAFEESARQREEYRRLVAGLKNGHIVDSSRPLNEVIAEVNEILLRHLATRIARRVRSRRQDWGFAKRPTATSASVPPRAGRRLT